MARTMPGGNTTHRLLRSQTAPTAGWTVGCWMRVLAYSNATVIGWGTGNTAMHGLLLGTTGSRITLREDCATTDMVMQVAGPSTSVWTCVIGVFANSVTATASSIFLGNQTTAMAAASHVVNTNGSGAFNAVTTGAFVGNNAASTLVVSPNIDIEWGFGVPWQMTLAEAQEYRQGNLMVIWRHGAPSFLVPMQQTTGAAVGEVDLVDGAAWTMTNTLSKVAGPPVPLCFQHDAVVLAA